MHWNLHCTMRPTAQGNAANGTIFQLCPILFCLCSSHPQIFNRLYLERFNEETQWAWWKAGMRVGIFWTLQGESLSLLKWQTVDLLTNTFSSQCSWIGYLYGLVNFSRSLSYGVWPTTHPRHQLCFTTGERLKRKTAKSMIWFSGTSFIDCSRWIIWSTCLRPQWIPPKSSVIQSFQPWISSTVNQHVTAFFFRPLRSIHLAQK